MIAYDFARIACGRVWSMEKQLLAQKFNWIHSNSIAAYNSNVYWLLAKWLLSSDELTPIRIKTKYPAVILFVSCLVVELNLPIYIYIRDYWSMGGLYHTKLT